MGACSTIRDTKARSHRQSNNVQDAGAETSDRLLFFDFTYSERCDVWMCESVRECNGIHEDVSDYVRKEQKYLGGFESMCAFLDGQAVELRYVMH